MKIFTVSDIHSFYTEFKKALDEKGFEANNSEHLLVICGDLFDRGAETVELVEYINSLTNVVLVRGNHEDLMEKMWTRGYAASYDSSNGTLRTFNSILYDNPDAMGNKDKFEIVREVLEPIFNRMVDYFETKNYVFVHGWIPMKYDTNKKFAEYGEPTLFDENWREGDWTSARWFNGIRKARNGIIVPGKTTICGHWHCSYGHMMESLKTDSWITEFEDDAIWEPYYAEGIIAIDRCTAYTGEVNVIVLEDELLGTSEKEKES
jgi:serine/threonine protein phosphatase 1